MRNHGPATPKVRVVRRHRARDTHRARGTSARRATLAPTDQRRRWTDEHGTQWHIRGAGPGLPRPVLRRLLRRTELRVLHAYGPHSAEVSGAEREALLDRVERYFAGDAPPHSTFLLAEFRDHDRNVMLVIEEAC